VADRSSVAVALLYETRERGEHLRDTLATLGAPIVYEAAASALDRDALARSHARVVIVNLDAGNDPALDDVYGLLDDERYRVVFNEGEVSSGLSGWDHARWVRHLSSKIFGEADIDPPRPSGASPVPVPPAREAAAASPPSAAHAGNGWTPEAPIGESPAARVDDVPAVDRDLQVADATRDATETPAAAETPTIDLDGLFDEPEFAPPAPAAGLAPRQHEADATSAFDIASIDFEGLFDEPGAAPAAPEAAASAVTSAPAEADLAEIEALLAGISGEEPSRTDAPMPVASDGFDLDDAGGADAPAVPSDAAFDFDFDFDEPLESGDASAASAAGEHAAPAPDVAPAAPAVAAPMNWSLESIEDAETPAPPVAPGTPANFGIEKMSAQEFLAPAAPAATVDDAPSELTLELIPLEEAVAPTQIDKTLHETWLDPDTRTRVRRVWVLGASIGGPESVREFLARFPRNYPALFVLAQHLGDEFVEMMAQQLARATPLTVRTPTHGERVGHGEVLIVPNGNRLTVDAEGVVVLEREEAAGAWRLSIDRVLGDVAERFGAGAGAIIFSGMGSDALEGCRRIAAKGGRVYVQSPESCVVSTMVDGVIDAGLATVQGTPKELADKLLAEPNQTPAKTT